MRPPNQSHFFSSSLSLSLSAALDRGSDCALNPLRVWQLAHIRPSASGAPATRVMIESIILPFVSSLQKSAARERLYQVARLRAKLLKLPELLGSGEAEAEAEAEARGALNSFIGCQFCSLNSETLALFGSCCETNSHPLQ